MSESWKDKAYLTKEYIITGGPLELKSMDQHYAVTRCFVADFHCIHGRLEEDGSCPTILIWGSRNKGANLGPQKKQSRATWSIFRADVTTADHFIKELIMHAAKTWCSIYLYIKTERNWSINMLCETPIAILGFSRRGVTAAGTVSVHIRKRG